MRPYLFAFFGGLPLHITGDRVRAGLAIIEIRRSQLADMAVKKQHVVTAVMTGGRHGVLEFALHHD